MEKSLIRGWPLIIWGGGRGADFHDRNFLFNSDHAPPRWFIVDPLVRANVFLILI